jgi:two-component system, OmpR family, response regulator MtrA
MKTEMKKPVCLSLHDWLLSESYKPDPYYQGNSALRLLCRDIYDHKVLDILLPGIDGSSVCKLYRDRSGRAKILVFTTDERNEDGAGAPRADAFPGGSADRQELSAQLRKFIQRSGDFCVIIIQIGRVKFYTADLRTLIDAERIALYPQEFALLAFLRTHPYVIFTTRKPGTREQKQSSFQRSRRQRGHRTS